MTTFLCRTLALELSQSHEKAEIAIIRSDLCENFHQLYFEISLYFYCSTIRLKYIYEYELIVTRVIKMKTIYSRSTLEG